MRLKSTALFALTLTLSFSASAELLVDSSGYTFKNGAASTLKISSNREVILNGVSLTTCPSDYESTKVTGQTVVTCEPDSITVTDGATVYTLDSEEMQLVSGTNVESRELTGSWFPKANSVNVETTEAANKIATAPASAEAEISKQAQAQTPAAPTSVITNKDSAPTVTLKKGSANVGGIKMAPGELETSEGIKMAPGQLETAGGIKMKKGSIEIDGEKLIEIDPDGITID
jgi:hypothetical protein